MEETILAELTVGQVVYVKTSGEIAQVLALGNLTEGNAAESTGSQGSNAGRNAGRLREAAAHGRD